jgi:lactate dehydrogenase-like 2-hydroxyacid dehydrogenase
MSSVALQMSRLPPFLERELRSRFDVCPWFELSDQNAWLKSQGGSVRVVVTGAPVGLPNEILRRLPSLGLIAVFGVGYDKVDVEEARRLGVRVTNTPGVVTDDVADLALALTICLLRNIPAADQYVRAGHWTDGSMPLARKVTGRHFGIVGLGRIGKAIAARFSALGPVAYTGRRPQAVPYSYHPSTTDLARACSVLIVATNADSSTRHLIGREVLDALGPDGYIVNIARGSLIDERELIAALVEKRIAGAALDVFEDEPRVPRDLRSLPNVVLTPHIGTATEETREDIGRLVLANLDAFLAGASLPSAVV